MSIITSYSRPGKSVDFDRINRAAIPLLRVLVRTWCPQGKMVGAEWQSLNPTRPDKNPGSFSINIKTGKWADFATGDRGGDPISLAAYVFGTSQAAAARTLAEALGIEVRQ